jgi:dihydrofolate reductase
MEKPIISMIAVIGKNRELGRKNELLWKIPEDMRRFKDLTSSHVVIMGQRTFQSIGKKLPDRENIVLSNDENFVAEGCHICHSVDEALEKAESFGNHGVFVIGGGQIYKQFIPLADKLYLTIVDREEKDADTYFPDYSLFDDRKVVGSGVTDDKIEYKFWEMTKNAKT